MTGLRPYQHDAIHALRRSIADGNRAPLLQMATGLGKSIVACALIQSAVAKSRRALFLAPRRQLVFQTSEKLDSNGITHGIIMSGERPSLIPQVQMASTSTLYRRCFENGKPVQASTYGKMLLPAADIIVCDEAHANFSSMAQTILAAYPEAVKIGMTATPARSDGRGLGQVYDDMVCGPSVRWAMDNGYLCELRYYGPSEWDMSGVQIQDGDYHQGQLSERVNQPKLIGDVVENWTRIAPDRITVVFAVDRKHARALHAEFGRWGIAAEYIDGKTPNEERHAIFARLESGESLVLCSVAVVDMGWDFPAASCAVLARPTKSLARYLQAVGRILRPAEGKQDACLIDHTGAVRELGFVDDPFEWTLEGVERQQRERNRSVAEEITITCPGCSALIRPGPRCPECGHEMQQRSERAIAAKEAELQEIQRKETERSNREWSIEDKARFYGELRVIGARSGYKEGWAAWAYRKRFGVWPNDRRIRYAPMREPGQAAIGWAQHLRIKAAKRRAA